MSDSTCSVPTCGRNVKRLGLCYGHYMKQWRYGTTHPEHSPRYTDLVGKRFGQLTVTAWADGMWEAQCDCGDITATRAGDLNRGTVSTCGASWHRLIADPGYSAAHGRVRRTNGPAKTRSCVDCSRPALHWSYDHADPDELTTDEGYAYSADPTHYEPRCVPCHKRFDLHRLDAVSVS